MSCTQISVVLLWFTYTCRVSRCEQNSMKGKKYRMGESQHGTSRKRYHLNLKGKYGNWYFIFYVFRLSSSYSLVNNNHMITTLWLCHTTLQFQLCLYSHWHTPTILWPDGRIDIFGILGPAYLQSFFPPDIFRYCIINIKWQLIELTVCL